MVTTQCSECGNNYEIEFNENIPECPECGFGPEECDHPMSERREGDQVPNLDDTEERYSTQIVCGKCGEVM